MDEGPGTYDPETRTWTAQVSHLSRYNSDWVWYGRSRVVGRVINPYNRGYRGASINVGGLNVNVSLAPPVGIIPLATNANGHAELPIAIPNVPGLSGTMVQAQWFVADAAGPLGLSATEGLEVEIIVK